MRVATAAFSAILIMEFVLHGLAMLIGMESGIKPLTDHFGFRPDRLLVLLIGVLDLAAAAGLVAAWWRPGFGALAAGYGLIFFGAMMILRFHRHLGTLLNPSDFPLFLALSVVVLMLTLVRL